MNIAFVAGFRPITREADAPLGLWRDSLGIDLEEAAPGYFTNDSLGGVK
ncbi:MAG: glyoxalase [Chloroflexi bacterium]|nr:glyoxalase [Chloroflexota bacterium]